MKPALRVLLPAILSLGGPVMGAATTNPFPGGVDADIWVLAGQSNMQGAGVITRQYTANPKVMVYGMDERWVPALPPTHRIFQAAAPAYKRLLFQGNPTFTEESWAKSVAEDLRKPGGGVGPDLFFADHVVEATGRHVGLIPCALGATYLSMWNPADRDQGGNSLYGNMINRIRTVGGNLRGVLWYQGEGETTAVEKAEAFEANFLNLVDSIRRDTGIADLPIIFVQIARYCLESDEMTKRWEMVQDKQRRVAGQRKNLWVVPAIDLPLDDLIHIGEAGHARLGRRMAEVALTHVYGLKGFATPIDYASYALLPSDPPLHHRMRVRFSGVTGRLQAPGRPTGFKLRPQTSSHDGPMVYKVELDPEDPAAVIVWFSKAITEPTNFCYGLGMDPYVNLTDSRDMAVPAFGPIVIEPPAAPAAK